MVFSGIPATGLGFLSQLAEHNDKDWFEQHRAAWDNELVPALLSLGEALTGRLRQAMPRLSFVPRVGGSVLRLTRDTRFGRDKRPFNTHAELVVWEGPDRLAAPSVWVQISPAELTVGGGLAVFEEAHLDRFRKLCHHDDAGTRLTEAVKAATHAGLKLGGEKLGRPPRPFNADHPRAELSRQLGLPVERTVKHAAWVHEPALLDHVEEAVRGYLPLHAWLRDELCRS